MVGGDDADIAPPHRREKLRQARVKTFEATGIASDVAAMAEFRVEIEKIGEDQSAVGRSRQGIDRGVEMRPIVGPAP